MLFLLSSSTYTFFCNLIEINWCCDAPSLFLAFTYEATRRDDASSLRCFFIPSPWSVNFMLRYSDEFISSSLNLRRVDFRETFAIIYYRAVATRQAPIWAPTVRYTIGIRKIIFTVELSSKQARINEDKLIAAAEAIHVNFTFLWGEILKKRRDKSINQPCSSRPENTWNTLWREMGLGGNGAHHKKSVTFRANKMFLPRQKLILIVAVQKAIF